MMAIPIDVFANTSCELSALIAQVLDDERVAQPATLASVREAVLAPVATPTLPLNRFSPDDLQQLQDEIEALIEAYGDDALAVDFLKPWASDSLCRLIDAGMDEFDKLTLGGLFEAAEQGLLAALVGTGEIDDDESQTVLAELQDLIDRHGDEALAGDFVREA